MYFRTYHRHRVEEWSGLDKETKLRLLGYREGFSDDEMTRYGFCESGNVSVRLTCALVVGWRGVETLMLGWGWGE